ncbi:MAG: winged helix-turn-helix transcriptional regulator [Candidatus Lokiarchaeota archaeon]|nr:winged helix-turn-helix transcriptional regulator [Candidatus Harpocratesius repetitus]
MLNIIFLGFSNTAVLHELTLLQDDSSNFSQMKENENSTPFTSTISFTDLSNSSGIIGNSFFHYQWDNFTLESENFTDISTYSDWFLLNNGTSDVWVEIQTITNLSYSFGGNTKYFTFEIFEDADNSVLDNWKYNISEFESIYWQGYEDYYWNNYQDDWMQYEDPNLEQPDYDLTGDSSNDSYYDTFSMEVSDFYENSIWGDQEDGINNWGFSDQYVQNLQAYEIMRDSLSGDEKWWFFNVYLEDWTDETTGTIGYKWIDLESGQQIDPTSINWSPVSGYEYDWEIAQWMQTNETINQTSEWAWFSYDLSQWVSWNDLVSDSIDFLITTTSFTGMSLYNDTNQNGIAEAFYDVVDSGSGSSNGLYYDRDQSEYISYITIDSFQDVVFNLDYLPDSENLNFSLTFSGVTLTSEPYGYDYESILYNEVDEWGNESWFDDNSTSTSPSLYNSSTSFYLENMTIACSFQTSELDNVNNASTFGIKHQLSDFLYRTKHSFAGDMLSGLGITMDYSVSSQQFSNIVSLSEPTTSYNLASVDVDGDVNIHANNSTIIQMELQQKYFWGKNNKEYWNTVALSPSYGFSIHYGDLNFGMAKDYSEQMAPYFYSLCFGNWEGYSIIMDPTFTSFLTVESVNSEFSPIPGQNNWRISNVLIIIFLSFAVVFGILMSKQEYRAFLLNRVMFLDTGAHRLSMEDVLENENRSKVIDLIVENPGIHFSELLRQTQLAPGNLNWHLEILERYKIIKSEIVGKYVMYFPYHGKNPLSNIDLKLQKSKTTMEILEIIQTTPGLSQNQIAKKIEKNHKTVKYHLDKLIKADLIKKRQEGRKSLLYPTIEDLDS